ncbi:hypothetical protein [Archangium primigenium]|uniref:hypothetical protein n=1 Tax=[Archangium] primigenium TaxID=2792470 RepID=UPI00195C6927|nr:hypothetical protein [Archangium primigenium]MBM7118480.1 hypothetical protein [Archangium primigenium]
MRKGIWIGVAVCLLVAAGAVVIGLKSTTPPAPAAPVVAAPVVAVPSPIADAGTPDAGQVAAASFARTPLSDAPWVVSPPVRLSTGETFPTVQAAIDAAQPGQTLLLAEGVYSSGMKLSGKKDLQIVAREGPAWFVVEDASEPILKVSNCERIRIEGLWLEWAPGWEEPAPLVDIEESSEVRLRSLYVGPGQRGIQASLAEGLSLEDILSDEHSEEDLRVEFPLGPVAIRHSWFPSRGHPVAMVEEGVDWEDPKVWVELPLQPAAPTTPDDEPLDRSLTIEESVFAGGLWFNVTGSPLTLTRSVVTSGEPRVMRALSRRVPASALLPEIPGADWSWRPGEVERDGMRVALARHARGIPADSEARMWIVDPHGSYPLCGPAGEVPVLDAPDGAEVAKVRKCELDFGETAALPTTRIQGQRDGWLQLDEGWVREKDVAAAEMIEDAEWAVPLPSYKAQVVSWAKDALTVRGESSPCENEHCADTSSEHEPRREEASEEEAAPEADVAPAPTPAPETEAEAPGVEDTVPLPRWLPGFHQNITRFHSPECCPC